MQTIIHSGVKKMPILVLKKFKIGSMIRIDEGINRQCVNISLNYIIIGPVLVWDKSIHEFRKETDFPDEYKTEIELELGHSIGFIHKKAYFGKIL
jgi:hypothetical protein